jgi:predicted N-acetyltransferase YhbS
MSTQVLTAETPAGRQAIDEVMRHSYGADIDETLAAWARVLVVDGTPVAYILVDPNRHMEHPAGDLPFAFICDVATRADRRREGHFAALVAHTFAALRESGVSLVLLHGRYDLYRRFGFDVFTHHSGLFITPQQIDDALGVASTQPDLLTVTPPAEYLLPGLLLVTDVHANSLAECKAALQSAAALARERGCARILFEYPAAPGYGSRYPCHVSLHTRFTALAQACGAQWQVQPANPEAGSIPDADWIKVLDAPRLLQHATHGVTPLSGHAVMLCIRTDAGDALLSSSGHGLEVRAGVDEDAETVNWPSSALAQLVTGYQSAADLAARYNTPLSPSALALLNRLFPRCWRLSRNESWTYCA